MLTRPEMDALLGKLDRASLEQLDAVWTRTLTETQRRQFLVPNEMLSSDATAPPPHFDASTGAYRHDATAGD